MFVFFQQNVRIFQQNVRNFEQNVRNMEQNVFSVKILSMSLVLQTKYLG